MNTQALEGMSQAELIALVASTQAKLQAVKAQAQRKLSLKVTEKGGLSLYGLGRFPVTLYRGQWERLLDEAAHIRAFIDANSELLSVKD